MKIIYLEIEERYQDLFIKRWKEECRREGKEVREGIPKRWREEKSENISSEMKGALIITDRQDSIDWAAGKNIACVGYEPALSKSRLSGADMIVQGFEELDWAYFEGIYRRHHGLPWIIAHTDRLLLRESIPEDFETIYGFYQEEGAAKYMPGMDREKEEEKKLFESYIRGMYPFFSYGLWTVLEHTQERIVGRVGLENGRYCGEPVLHIGYMIGRKYRKCGYAGEAVEAALNYGFQELEAEKIYAFIDERNEDSRRLAERVGFLQAENEREGICVYYMQRY